MVNLYKFLLKFYLNSFYRFNEWFVDRLGIRAFGGLHPKNIFNLRTDFFLSNVSPGDFVLDIACGTGQILKTLEPAIKAGLGLDYNKNILLLAQGSQTKIQFKRCDILKEDYTKLKTEFAFNTVILSHILEHIENPVEFLKQLPQTKLLICVPSQENWRAQLKKKLSLPFYSDKTHFREYTRVDLEKELDLAGYRAQFIGFNSEGEIICSAHPK